MLGGHHAAAAAAAVGAGVGGALQGVVDVAAENGEILGEPEKQRVVKSSCSPLFSALIHVFCQQKEIAIAISFCVCVFLHSLLISRRQGGVSFLFFCNVHTLLSFNGFSNR